MPGETPEDWLKRYYESGDREALNLLNGHYWRVLDRFLRVCVSDLNIREKIVVKSLLHLLRSRLHPELRWDLRRGRVDGFMFGIAGHLMYRWLVWFQDPEKR